MTGVIYGENDRTSRESLQTLGGMRLSVPSEARTSEEANTVIATFDTGTYGFKRLAGLLDVTAAATDAGDTLDVLVDVSIDGQTWVNVIHFTQVVGNGGAVKYFASTPDAGAGVEEAVTSDVSAGGTPRVTFGRFVRVRQTLVEASTDNASFTYSVDLTVS